MEYEVCLLFVCQPPASVNTQMINVVVPMQKMRIYCNSLRMQELSAVPQ